MKTLDLSSVSSKTITRWRAAGAPLANDSRLRAWLAGRKHLPKSIRDQLVSVVSEKSDSDSDASAESAGGAAEALARLEAEEIRAYQRLQAALAGGDPLTIKAERDGWLKISESLRRYDLAVEESRRVRGELLPRAEVEKLLGFLARIWPILAHKEAEALSERLAGSGHQALYDGIRGVVTLRFFETLAGYADQCGHETFSAIVRKTIQGHAWTVGDAATRMERSKMTPGEVGVDLSKIWLAGRK